MTDTKDALLQMLIDIDFANLFYRFYEARKARQGSEGIDPAVVARVMEDLGFKYHKRDRFYGYSEKHGDRELKLHVAFAKGTVELILIMRAGEAALGGPFAVLAEQVALRANPSFSYTPPYPRIPYSTERELREVVLWGRGIYDEVKSRLFGDAAKPLT